MFPNRDFNINMCFYTCLNRTTLLAWLDGMIYATGLIGTWCYAQRSKKISIVKKESDIHLNLTWGRAECQIDFVWLRSQTCLM